MSKKRLRNGRIDILEALRHLREFHPGMPVEHAARVAENIAGRSWHGLTLGNIVGIAVTCYARHELTDYERLLRVPGMTREEARMLVADDLQDVLGGWRMGPPAEIPASIRTAMD